MRYNQRTLRRKNFKSVLSGFNIFYDAQQPNLSADKSSHVANSPIVFREPEQGESLLRGVGAPARQRAFLDGLCRTRSPGRSLYCLFSCLSRTCIFLGDDERVSLDKRDKGRFDRKATGTRGKKKGLDQALPLRGNGKCILSPVFIVQLRRFGQ